MTVVAGTPEDSVMSPPRLSLPDVAEDVWVEAEIGVPRSSLSSSTSWDIVDAGEAELMVAP